MSRLLARVMMAIFMLPVATIVYVITFTVLWENVLRRREEQCFVAAGFVTAAFVGVYWIALWARSVRWNTTRTSLTVVSALAALGLGGVVAAAMARVEDELGAFMFGPTAVFSWLIATVMIWRETAAERAGRLAAGGSGGLVCPACGYNMTGLRQSTCPECGARYTVDELLARQPGREDGEIEPSRPAA